MKNQKSTLKTLNRTKKIKNVECHIEKISEYQDQLINLNFNKKDVKMKIMGLEGKTSYEYWNGIKLLVPDEINFKSRTKKPTDLLNSMLNYGYAILASEITKNILLKGLDPYCGFLHYDMDNRTSLTFDLIEPFRQQIVDKTVLGLINRKQITVANLDKRNNSIKLNARKLIVSKILNKIYSTVTYDGKTMSYSDIIRFQCDNLERTLMDGEKFKSFALNW